MRRTLAIRACRRLLRWIPADNLVDEITADLDERGVQRAGSRDM